MVYINFSGGTDTTACEENCNPCIDTVILSDAEGIIGEQVAGHGFITNCTWLIRADAGMAIRFKMELLYLKSWPNCSHAMAYLEVR